MSSLNRKLQAGPKAFKRVDMTTIARILTRSMINRSVPVSSFGNAEVRTKFVSVNGAPLLDIFFNDRLQGALANIRHNLSHNVSFSFKHTEDHGFVGSTSTPFPRAVASDIGFIGFYITIKRVFVIYFRHVFANLVSHAPRCFIGNSYLPLKFLGRDAVAGSGKQIHCIKPFMKRRMGTLHRRSYARIKIVLAMLADICRMALEPVEIAKCPALRAVESTPAIAGNKHVFKACRVIWEKLLKLIKSHLNLLYGNNLPEKV